MSKRFFQEVDEEQDDVKNDFTYHSFTPDTRANGHTVSHSFQSSTSSSSMKRSRKQRFLDEDDNSENESTEKPSPSFLHRPKVIEGSSMKNELFRNLSESSNTLKCKTSTRKHKLLQDFFADDDDDEYSVNDGQIPSDNDDERESNSSLDKNTVEDEKINIAATYGVVEERHFGDEFRPFVDNNDFKQPNQSLVLAETEGKTLLLHKYAARQLLDHQVEGSTWIAKNYLSKKGGILGDEMGLGKTIQVIAFLNALYQKSGLAEQDKEWMRIKKRHDETSQYPSVQCQEYCQSLPTFIICPKTLVDNWKRELNKWGYFLLDILSTELGQEEIDGILQRLNHQRCDILLISYSQVGSFFQDLAKIQWNMIIYDEGHLLKNPNNQTYERISLINQAVCRLILTGTPLQNNLAELWSLLHLLDKDRYPERKLFSKEIARPIKIGISSNATKDEVKAAKKAQEKVETILSDCLIQRKKNVLKGLSALKGKDEIIVLCDLSPLQQELYQHCLALPDFENVRFHASICPCGSKKPRGKCCPEYRFPYQRSCLPSQFKIDERAALWREFHEDDKPCDAGRKVSCPLCILLPCLNMLSKIASHPMLIQADPKFNDIEKQLKAERFVRAAFPDSLVEKLGGVRRSNRFMTMKSTEVSGKMKTLREMLAHFIRNSEKSLVFSLRTQVLDVLEAMCIAEGWKFLRLDGQTATKRRQQLVDEYNKDPEMMIFLISSRAGGVGLNLSSANKVIIFDVDWNPVVDMQSQDRAYRIGQLEHVSVYRLVAKGTIEELAYMRQLYKQQFHQVVLPDQQNIEEQQINAKKKFQRGRFEGVDGEASMRGELFGVENLFQFSKESILHALREKYDGPKSSGSSSSSNNKDQGEQKAKRSIPSTISKQSIGNEDVNLVIRKLVEDSSNVAEDRLVENDGILNVSGEENGAALTLLQNLGINLKNAHSLDQMLQELKEGSNADETASENEEDNGITKPLRTKRLIIGDLQQQNKKNVPRKKERKFKIFDPNQVLPLHQAPTMKAKVIPKPQMIFPRQGSKEAKATTLIDLTSYPAAPSPQKSDCNNDQIVDLINITPPSSQSSSHIESPDSGLQKSRKLPNLSISSKDSKGGQKSSGFSLYKPSYKK